MSDDLDDAIISPDTRRTQRIPPGQTETHKWPVLHYGNPPRIDRETWRLVITGLVAEPVTFTWDRFTALPRVKVRCDIHCVTYWSRLDNMFEGPSVREVLSHVEIRPEAAFAIQISDGDPGRQWSTNLPLDAFMDEDCLFALSHDGEPLSTDHGGPVRVVIPKLYFWKSCKWVRRIELTATDAPGFWEQNGYHNHGDPWTEERFGY